MTKRPLSELQRRALEGLKDGQLHSSYDLRATLTTMRALEARGLVRSRHELGSIFSPQTNIKWRVTNDGLRALKEKAS